MLDFMINFCTQDQFLTHVVQTEEERSTEENAAGGHAMASPLARIRNIDITNHIYLYKIGHHIIDAQFLSNRFHKMAFHGRLISCAFFNKKSLLSGYFLKIVSSRSELA